MFNLNKLFFNEDLKVSSKKAKHLNALKLKKKKSEKEEIHSGKITLHEIRSRKIQEEFKFLNKQTKNITNKKEIITSSEYKIYNRYTNILPFKENIVKLEKGELTPKNYIHANYIIDKSGQSKKKYIITQGPKENTSNSFWKMIEKNKTNCIVAIVENEQLPKKCFCYWPIINEKNVETEDYIIISVFSKESGFFCKKKLKVFNKISNTQFEVNHFHLFNWVDHSIIKKEFFLEFFEFISKLIINKKYNGPFVTHCSAGVGRSGTFVSCLYLIENFIKSKKKQEFKFSVFNTVLGIRSQRNKAIKRYSQYEFLYDFLLSLRESNI